jgi:hypothetical protein
MKDCIGVYMSKTNETITEFDLSDYLDSDEAISEQSLVLRQF